MDKIGAALARARTHRSLPAPEMRRLLRERAGISQAAIAEALNVSRPAVTRWESGEREPTGDNLMAYLRLLNRLAAEVAR